MTTQWDFAAPPENVHDEVSTDKRNPTLHPCGRVWGIRGVKYLWAGDSKTNRVDK